MQHARSSNINIISSRGLTLLELMVGLTIGLVVSTAAIGTMVFLQASNQLNGEVSRMQQDATLAFNLIGQYLRSSGSVGLNQTIDGGISLTPLTTFSGIPGTGGAVIQGKIEPGNKEVLQSAISILSASGFNGSQYDCLGNTLPSTSTTLITSFDLEANAKTLRCASQTLPGGTTNPQPIIGNVEQFVVHYGVRNENTLQYQSFSSSIPWTQVVSVRVCLMLLSQAPVADFADLFTGTSTLTFPDCNMIDRSTEIKSDRLMRRVYRQVFTIRPAST